MAAAAARAGRLDALGLRRALSDRMLPFLVGAMALLAALAIAGWVGAAGLARYWQQGAGSALTVQVPSPAAASTRDGAARLPAVLEVLGATPGVASARALTEEELGELLRPWLGAGADRVALPLPAVVAVQLSAPVDPRALGARIAAVAPGSLVEDHGLWLRRLTALARSLQACAGLTVVLVVAVATSVIAVATRAGLAARREAIEIVHGLGATDGYIAGRFARRATFLAAMGGIGGAIAAAPVLLMLVRITQPFAGGRGGLETVTSLSDVAGIAAAVPLALWLMLPGLPVAAALIGYATAHWTVRRWLRQLP